MSPVSFEHPALLCLVVLPALTLLLSWRGFQHTIDAESASVATVLRFWLSALLRFLSAAAVVLALAGLAIGERVSISPKKDVAVAIIFDMHKSEQELFFEDMTKLDAAKVLTTSLLERLECSGEEVLVSLVVCHSDKATLLSPYTCDFGWLRSCIAHLEIESEVTGEAALTAGLEVAINSLPESSPAKPFVLLFCDEDAVAEEEVRALNKAKDAGAAVAALLFPPAYLLDPTAGSANNVDAWQGTSLVVSLPDEGAGEQLVSFLGIGGEKRSLRVAVKTKKRTLTHQLVIAAAWLFALSVFIGQLVPKGQKALLPVLLCALSLFAGCSGHEAKAPLGSLADEWKIARGRAFWKAGDWQRAISYFLDAAESSKIRGDDDACSLAQAALGTSYLMIGKDDAAFEKYQEAWEGSSREVRFLILYNEGIAYYRRGEPSVASEHFKQALILKSNSLDAKVNLELSLKAASGQGLQDARKAAWVSGDEGEFRELLYSIVQQEEEAQWEAAKEEEH